MDLKEKRYQGIGDIHLTHEKRVFMNMLMNFGFYMRRNFFCLAERLLASPELRSLNIVI